MATPMTAAQWRAQLTKWHVDYHLYSGYDGRGRPGSWAPVGIVIHHTGSDSGQSDSYLEFLFVTGRPEDNIPGPLCNVATDMDGDLHLGATGRANHAGSGDQTTLDKVQNPASWDGYSQLISPGSDDLIGNGYFYGNELRYDGGQPPTGPMYETVVLFCAAVCDFHGWTAERVIGHKEWTARKNDPGNLNMAALRRDVRDALAAGPGNWPEMGDDMPTAQEVADAVWAKVTTNAINGAPVNVLNLLRYAHGDITHLQSDVTSLDSSVSAVFDAVGALQAVVDKVAAATNADGDGVWGVQIADVFTPESGDTSAASTLLTYGPGRAGEAALVEIQPHLDEIKAAVAAVQSAVEALTPPEPPAPLS